MTPAVRTAPSTITLLTRLSKTVHRNTPESALGMTLAVWGLFGLVARLPFAFAAGLGINSFLAVNVVQILTWQEAMGLVVINGLIIVLLAATGLRRLIFNAVPQQLKTAITVGIGLFIAFIGFVDSGFVRSTNMSSPPVQLGEAGSIATVPTLIFLLALVIMGVSGYVLWVLRLKRKRT